MVLANYDLRGTLPRTGVAWFCIGKVKALPTKVVIIIAAMCIAIALVVKVLGPEDVRVALQWFHSLVRSMLQLLRPANANDSFTCAHVAPPRPTSHMLPHPVHCTLKLQGLLQ